jgi:hypothetical protein
LNKKGVEEIESPGLCAGIRAYAVGNLAGSPRASYYPVAACGLEDLKLKLGATVIFSRPHCSKRGQVGSVNNLNELCERSHQRKLC